MGSAEEIPSREILSGSRYVVLDASRKLIAECQTVAEAAKALASYIQKHPKKDAAIYCRMRDAWVKY